MREKSAGGLYTYSLIHSREKDSHGKRILPMQRQDSPAGPGWIRLLQGEAGKVLLGGSSVT